MKLSDLFEKERDRFGIGDGGIDPRHHNRAGNVYKKKMMPFLHEFNRVLPSYGFRDLNDLNDFMLDPDVSPKEYYERLNSLRALQPLIDASVSQYQKLYNKFGDVMHWVQSADVMNVEELFQVVVDLRDALQRTK